MSESVEKIERLRHRLREMEREARQSERIRKSLAVECEIEESLEKVEDEQAMKEEIMRAWMIDYDSSVQCLLNNEAGDNSWLDVVGDVMDEMRQRVIEAQKGAEKSEIDLRSIMALIDEDVKNLGELCAELLQKFMGHRLIVEKEKYRRRKLLSEAGGRTQDTKDTDGLNVTSISINEETSKVGGDESKDVKCLQETLVELSMGDFESKETKAAIDQKSKDNNAETMGENESKKTNAGDQALEEIPAENYIKFSIVDEKNRPLGAKSDAATEPDGDGAPKNQEQDRAVSMETPDCGAYSPTCPSPVPDGGCVSPPPASEASSAEQPTNEPSTGEIWLQVASTLIDQNRSNDEASVDVFEIVNMFMSSDEDGSSDVMLL